MVTALALIAHFIASWILDCSLEQPLHSGLFSGVRFRDQGLRNAYACRDQSIVWSVKSCVFRSGMKTATLPSPPRFQDVNLPSLAAFPRDTLPLFILGRPPSQRADCSTFPTCEHPPKFETLQQEIKL